jgi:hypothetical protein
LSDRYNLYASGPIAEERDVCHADTGETQTLARHHDWSLGSKFPGVTLAVADMGGGDSMSVFIWLDDNEHLTHTIGPSCLAVGYGSTVPPF